MRKCTACGNELPEPILRDYQYRALPSVVLRDMPVNVCDECGGFEVAIPAMDPLEHELLRLVCARPGRLYGHELRYLSRALGRPLQDAPDSPDTYVSRPIHEHQGIEARYTDGVWTCTWYELTIDARGRLMAELTRRSGIQEIGVDVREIAKGGT